MFVTRSDNKHSFERRFSQLPPEERRAVADDLMARARETALSRPMRKRSSAKGKGIAGTYTFEVAEEKQSEVLLMAKVEEHPLRVEVERV